MHNLEKSIADWRRNLSAGPKIAADEIDELESHLRETIDQLVRSGLTEPEAFERATKQLGGSATIASEFRKLDPPTWLPIKLVIGAYLTAMLAFAIFSIAFSARPSGLLLATHVFTITLGYTTTLLIGALGICFVGQRSLSDFSPMRHRALTRVTFRFGCVATALTAVGVIMGMFWANAEWGRYWAWDMKETGGFCIVLWQLSFLIAHRFPRSSARFVPLASILGNIVVTLGWFGPNLPSSGLHDYQSGTYSLLLLATVAIHFTFFLLGFAPAGWLRLRKAS
jgi:hypothetical protein